MASAGLRLKGHTRVMAQQVCRVTFLTKKWIVQSIDDQACDRDRPDKPNGTAFPVIVKSIGKAVYRCGVAVVKLQEVVDPVNPLNLDFLPELCFLLYFFLDACQKAPGIDPIARM